MAGRKVNLRGPRDKEQSQKPKRKQRSHGLNALAVAEKQYPSKTKIRAHRYGEEEGDSKRKRDDGPQHPSKRARTGEADDESSVEGGSDSDGNEWQIGNVDSEDDSEIDSDEALGESDEERFEGFTFRGSSSTKSKAKKKPTKKQVDLSEDVEQDGSEDDDSDDDLGYDAVDLAAAWDMNGEEDGPDPNRKKNSGASEDEDEEEDDDEESDDSGLSLSDDEEDKANSRGLSKLRNFIDSMETDLANSTKGRSMTVQEHGKPTEYGLTPSRKLTAADLMSNITDSRLKSSLKHLDTDPSTQKGKSSTGAGKLEAPLPKRQQDRLDRAAAFDKSKATLNRWVDTVKANRQAAHLSFPLPEPDGNQSSQIREMKPQTDLESTIQNILLESGLSEPKAAEDKIQEFEELEAKKLPLEEIQARRAELRKARELLFREEVRSKRIKKIKSKAYRRVHRKQRERQEFQERQALEAAGVDMDEEERERNERMRAESRMGAKHRESKWAKSVKKGGRAAWDEDARLGMADIARRDEELQKRIQGKRVTNEDDESSESSSSESEDDAFEQAGSDAEREKLQRKMRKLEGVSDNAPADNQGSRLMSMKFMQNAEATRKALNDAEVRRLKRQAEGRESESESDGGDPGRQRFGVKSATDGKSNSAPVIRNEFEERLDSDDEERAAADDDDIDIVVDRKPNQEPVTVPKKLRKLGNQANGTTQAEDPEENPWLTQTKRNNRKVKVATNEPADLILANELSGANAKAPKKTVAKPPASRKGRAVTRHGEDADDEDDSDEEEDEERVPVLLKNTDLVKKAFAGDEVLEDFNKEKIETTKDEDDKVVDNTLPGWGSWTGEGVSKKQKKQEKRFLTTVEGIKADKRKDAKLDRVIINEKRVKKNKKYLASQLPHPFETRQQYERSLRLPVGPEWTTKDTFQKSTKPRLLVKQGVIKPMQKPLV
ncbi:hypothetical protein FQN54_004013 [Arachnomyces sp. PD_36]|nr:hypothetical protein FQN54_004013 [Arachnomyces sp. PD_36]